VTLFDDPAPVDEEMVKLATQLVDRQTFPLAGSATDVLPLTS
jgi:hypothetical protein